MNPLTEPLHLRTETARQIEIKTAPVPSGAMHRLLSRLLDKAALPMKGEAHLQQADQEMEDPAVAAEKA